MRLQEGWIPVPGHWDDKKRSTGMTPSCPVHVAINIKEFTK
ncbi:hypothetical protein [Wolbachia endosymbiont (group A) of Pogonocherus hispidulus]